MLQFDVGVASAVCGPKENPNNEISSSGYCKISGVNGGPGGSAYWFFGVFPVPDGTDCRVTLRISVLDIQTYVGGGYSVYFYNGPSAGPRRLFLQDDGDYTCDVDFTYNFGYNRVLEITYGGGLYLEATCSWEFYSDVSEPPVCPINLEI